MLSSGSDRNRAASRNMTSCKHAQHRWEIQSSQHVKVRHTSPPRHHESHLPSWLQTGAAGFIQYGCSKLLPRPISSLPVSRTKPTSFTPTHPNSCFPDQPSKHEDSGKHADRSVSTETSRGQRCSQFKSAQRRSASL